jgi:magnesium-transporting ATPase (P-type)
MTSVGILGIVLALEPKETGIMARPPRDPKAPILRRDLIWRILLVGFLILAGAFGLFEWELTQGASLAQSRTVAVNAVITIATFYLLNCRSLVQSVFRQGLFSNQWVWMGFIMMAILQLAFTYIPFMNRILASAPISADAWLRILAVGLVSFLVIEFEKWVRRRSAFRGTIRRDKTPVSPQMPV